MPVRNNLYDSKQSSVNGLDLLLWSREPVRPTNVKEKNMMKILITPGALALALFTMTLVPPAKADEWNKRTVITVQGGAVQIQGTVLEPGKYVLKLVDSQSNRRMLEIFNADETKLETTIFANLAYRLDPTPDTRFAFAEQADGQPKAIRTLFFSGDSYGLQFVVR